MNFRWFKIFNKTEFLATGLVSRTYTHMLTGIGQRDILVTQALTLGMTYEGIFLSVQMNDLNPFVMDGHAAYIAANNDVYLGLPIEN